VTQAAALKCRETPKGRSGRAGLRLSPKRLEVSSLRCAVLKLYMWGQSPGWNLAWTSSLHKSGSFFFCAAILTLGCPWQPNLSKEGGDRVSADDSAGHLLAGQWKLWYSVCNLAFAWSSPWVLPETPTVDRNLHLALKY
jgi:hypothetical protein